MSIYPPSHPPVCFFKLSPPKCPKEKEDAIVDNLIRNTLWQELPNSYDVSDIQTYQKKIYEYVYMRYPEVA